MCRLNMAPQDALQPLETLVGSWRFRADCRNTGPRDSRPVEPHDRRVSRQNTPYRGEWRQKNTGGGRSIGTTKGGLNSKLHLVCDGHGCPVHLALTAGNQADITQARQCLEPYVAKGCTVIADRGYDANHLRDWLSKTEAAACIPPRKNRKVQFEYDADLYKTRNIVERMFNRLKDWRQLSLRTFRCPETFLAAAQIAATAIWLL